MRVYRLEFLQPDGRWTGPYCAEYMTITAFEVREEMIEKHRNSVNHTYPDAEVLLEILVKIAMFV